MSNENHDRVWWLTIAFMCIFIMLLFVVITGDYLGIKVSQEYRDIFNILLGAFLAKLTKLVDYWIHPKKEKK